MSKVIGFGALLSFLGPLCASLASHVAAAEGEDPVQGYAVFFLFNAAFALIIFVAACFLRLPPLPVAAKTDAPQSLCQTLCRRPVWTGIVAQSAVQFAMTTPMTAMPLVMDVEIPHMHAGSFGISGCIILHVTCMFAPGFFTGKVVSRLGDTTVLGVGLGVQAVGLCVGLASLTTVGMYISLALIGVGWNLAFVSGTVLLIASFSPAEKTTVTSANETLRFAVCGLAVLLSSTLPWTQLCLICLGTLGWAFGTIFVQSTT